jgi:hypothetical protein
MRNLVAFALAVSAVATGSDARAQVPVHDVGVTARNAATAIAKEFVLQTQREEHARLRRMAQRLSLFTDLRKYVLADPPRWRTHAEDLIFAGPYATALIFGDPSGSAYVDLTHRLSAGTDRLARLPATVAREFLTRLATVDMTDAAVIAATHDTGQLRLNGRKQELPAIDALERDVVDPAIDQSATAILDKISGGVLIGARQRQARIQLLVGVMEQLLVDSKRARDTEASAVNMQLFTWRAGRAVNEAFVEGTGDAIRTWRQP